MEVTKESAVEYLFEKINDALIDFTEGKISASMYGSRVTEYKQKAKEMHKVEIEKVSEDWWNEGASYMYNGQRKYNSFEQYYNETYGKAN
tara:strand:+ start:521 stop:790 length:270 start_codon:yes stop_codon:yes gene_type:complete